MDLKGLNLETRRSSRRHTRDMDRVAEQDNTVPGGEVGDISSQLPIKPTGDQWSKFAVDDSINGSLAEAAAETAAAEPSKHPSAEGKAGPSLTAPDKMAIAVTPRTLDLTPNPTPSSSPPVSPLKSSNGETEGEKV